jgi:hypothetical protein
MAKKTPRTKERNLAATGQHPALSRVDELKQKLLGTDREDHWQEVLDLEREVKEVLLKRDLTRHQGMQLLLKWMAAQVRQIQELLNIAKSDQVTPSQRDGMIEVRDFILALVAFLDPSGRRLKEITRELDYQLEEDEDDIGDSEGSI